MPTARELLEQADALMRRNRSPAADDIPVLTEAVSPAPVLRVPLRPSPESPPRMLAEDDAAAGTVPGVIPTLTERVPPGEPARDVAVLAEGEPSDWLDFDEGEPSITGQAPDSVMSVPEVVTAEALREVADAGLDEATITEEIELGPATEAEVEADADSDADSDVDADADADADAAFRGAPAPGPAEATALASAALPPGGTVQEPTRDASAEARPEVSAAVTDPPAAPVDERPAARIPWPDTELPPEIEALPALAAEAELVFDSPSSVSWNVEAVLAGPAPDADAHTAMAATRADASPAAGAAATAFATPPATEADEPILAAAEAPAAGTPVPPPSPVGDVPLVPSPAEAFVPVPEPLSARDAVTIDAMAPHPQDEPEPVPAAVTGPSATWESPFATMPAAIESPVMPPAPVAPAVIAPVLPPAVDDARWAAMAEEIRMQVLQRIDLFTDEGLREQLGQRLQPIVDRASADLVRTINQHVGELLRAYVAEAIEREIERWKTSQQ